MMLLDPFIGLAIVCVFAAAALIARSVLDTRCPRCGSRLLYPVGHDHGYTGYQCVRCKYLLERYEGTP